MAKIARKLLRIVGGSLFPVLCYFVSNKFMIIFTAIVFLVFVFLEIIRFKSVKINKWLFKNLSAIFKVEEKRKVSAITYFLIGVLITILFFEKNIAIITLFFLFLVMQQQILLVGMAGLGLKKGH